MKRTHIGTVAVLAAMLAPAALGQDRYCDRNSRVYESYSPVQDSYYSGAAGYYDRRGAYDAPREYNYDRNSYGYYDRDQWGRTAKYVGGGAAAGAVLGALIGHGKGAAIGALAGGAGGYLYKRHNDHRDYAQDRRY